jgi:hypothetical protein
MWKDQDLLKKHPELHHANEYAQQHRQRQRKSILGEIGAMIGYAKAAPAVLKELETYAPWIVPWIKSLPRAVASVAYLYCVAPFGVALAAACLLKATYDLQKAEGFLNLGLGGGTVDALIVLLGGYVGMKTGERISQAVLKINWASRIIALFFVYSVGVWWIHGHSWEENPLGAYFLCIVVSLMIEGVVLRYWAETKRVYLAIRNYVSQLIKDVVELWHRVRVVPGYGAKAKMVYLAISNHLKEHFTSPH